MENLKTIEEVAAHLGVHRLVIYRACKRGELPSKKIGRRIYVPAASLSQFDDVRRA